MIDRDVESLKARMQAHTHAGTHESTAAFDPTHPLLWLIVAGTSRHRYGDSGPSFSSGMVGARRFFIMDVDAGVLGCGCKVRTRRCLLAQI